LLLNTRKDMPKQILAVLEAEVPAKAARIAGLLLNRQKSTAAPTRRGKAVSPAPAVKAPPNEGLVRIRAYVERHPADTEALIASALKCSVKAVRTALGDG
jgi:hypothetical protein